MALSSCVEEKLTAKPSAEYHRVTVTFDMIVGHLLHGDLGDCCAIYKGSCRNENTIQINTVLRGDDEIARRNIICDCSL